ncbi:outer membrane protein assembly factor BamB family protein [Rhodococcus chondri]|uniref:PQQ-binding-like beta-propeller repeat protein n=1 Tax=Rhodococcus chondri TaxID=3065941 RepID=A0ABU7JT30_9NOCA|nr:PQQ-binding-like beta-propeller repeat protein [Rhodococcus sp. CC-R104]MEE2033169.1 PQQ-binding-like beta-propeller repeat protein [Rhodococcus sp. CC-R104]
MRGVLRAAVLVATAALALSGCGGEGVGTDVYSAGGWPGRYSDARNSGTAGVEGLDDVTVAWSRSTGGMVGSPVSIAANGQIFVTAATDSGCNLFSYRIDTGRKRWCTRLAPGVTGVTPVADAVANVYVGEDGALVSFNEHGQRRWRIPVSGTPRTAQFTGEGKLVVITHFGQVNVVEPQTGELLAPLYDLVPTPELGDGQNVPRLPSGHGLAACFGGSADCPVATTPAVDLSTDRIFTTLWRPGADGAALVSLRYTGGDDAAVTEGWSRDDLPGGAATSPVLSEDGATVYIHDGDGALWALDSETGEPKWTHDLGFTPAAGPTVTADGVLVLAASGENGTFLALRDAGDRAETHWEQEDVRQVGVPAVTSNGLGYTVVESGDGIGALVFDAGSGEPLDEEPLPGATGFSVGTAVGPDGELVAATVTGEVFVLR